MEIKKHMNLLGLEAQDKVSGLKGIVTSVSFELYGCVQVIITPKAVKNERKSGQWYDVSRLKILKKTPVMKRPNFDYGPVARGEQGCSNKPVL